MTESEILTTIKEHMKSAAITHEMAAELSGLKQSNISRLLSGKYSPNLKTLLRLADAVEVELTARVKTWKHYDVALVYSGSDHEYTTIEHAPNSAPKTPE